MKVLVTDGDNRAALAVTRSLGRAGHEVVVGATSGRSLAQSSRYCRATLTYPNPTTAPEGFVAALEQAVPALGIDAVLPIADITTFLVTANRARFGPSCAVPCADAAVVERAADKVDIVRTAERIGVPVPQSIVVSDPDDVPEAGLEFPLYVKPWRSRIRTAGGWASTSVSYAATRADLDRDLRARGAHEFPVMLQERIVGPGRGVFACFDRGRPVALFSHRRLRERPPWGGVSVLAESVPVSSPAREHAVQLLEAIGWHGVAMVEFKEDVRDGQPKLMEINGRFWGSLQLAIDAGVDFPAILLQTLGPAPVAAQAPYKIGVRTRWFWGDVDSLIQTMARRGPPEAQTSRLRAAVEFAKVWSPRLHYDNPKWDDPKPFAFETRERLEAIAGAIGLRRPSVAAAAVSPSGSALEVRSAATLTEVGLDAAAWNALAARSATNSVFQTHQWAQAWTRTYADRHDPWFAVAHEGGTVVGVAPLVVDRDTSQGRIAHFVGEGRADYCDLLAPADRPDVAAALWTQVLADRRWDVLELGNVPEQSSTPAVLASACRAAGLKVDAERQFACPTLLVAGREAEAARVIDKASLRRRLSHFERLGAVTVRDLTTAADIEARLDAFFAQHVARWQQTGSPSLFEKPRNTRFYRELTAAFDGTGWLLFSEIECGGRSIACHFGFDYNGAVLWYKPSFDPAHRAHSPGLLMVRHLVRYALDHGRRELDFTVGDEPFKQRFTNHVRHTVRLRVFRSALARMQWRSRHAAVSLLHLVPGLVVPE